MFKKGYNIVNKTLDFLAHFIDKVQSGQLLKLLSQFK